MDINTLLRPVKKVVAGAIRFFFGEKGGVWFETELLIGRLKHGLHETEIDLLQHFVLLGDVCLDVGANFGEWSYFMSKRTGPSGRVIAFEPVPVTVQILKRVKGRLKLTNVEIHQIALGNENKRAAMRVEAGKLPMAQLVNDQGSDGPSVRVDMMTLDSFMANNDAGRISFIKCDIEGAEPLFLEGGRTTITKHRPTIVCEIQEEHCERFGNSPNKIFEFLADLNYSAYYYSSKKLIPVKGLVNGKINYVFIHNDKSGKLQRS